MKLKKRKERSPIGWKGMKEMKNNNFEWNNIKVNLSSLSETEKEEIEIITGINQAMKVPFSIHAFAILLNNCGSAKETPCPISGTEYNLQ